MHYYINVLKEIEVTDSFLTMDKEIRECQDESFDDCTTRNYMNTLINECQCLPFQIRLMEKVGSIITSLNSSLVVINITVDFRQSGAQAT